MLYYLAIFAVILLVVLLISIPYYFWEWYTTRKDADRFFVGRRPLSDSAFYSSYFQTSSFQPELGSKVRDILKEECQIDARVVPHDRIHEIAEILNLDGFDLVELLMRLEEEFGIRIDDNEAESCKTFGDVYDLVARKVGGQFTNA